jgi:hypothetical protein
MPSKYFKDVKVSLADKISGIKDRVEKANDGYQEHWNWISNSKTDTEFLLSQLDKHQRALELALYYVEGDATWESVKAKIESILKGE